MSDQNITADQGLQYQPLNGQNVVTPKPVAAKLSRRQLPSPPSAPVPPVKQTANPEPLKANSLPRYNTLILILIFVVIIGLLAFWRPSWLKLPARLTNQPKTTSIGYNQDEFLNDSHIPQTDSKTDQQLLAQFSTNTDSPSFLPLTVANSGQYQPERATYVPYVLDSDDSTLHVFATSSQTVITIPHGWVGETITNTQDRFQDLEHGIELMLGFFNSQKEFATVDQLKNHLETIYDEQPTLGFNLNQNITVEEIDKKRVLIRDLQETGNRYSVYQLNPNEPNKPHETILYFNHHRYSLAQERELLDTLIKSQQIIGIDPHQPFELSEFLKSNHIQ